MSDLIDIAKRGKYPLEAYAFVQRGLEFTVRQRDAERAAEASGVHGADDLAPDLVPDADGEWSPQDAEPEHITGAQLCHGLRDFAVQQYGLLARPVLRHWRVNDCLDFGRIVFALVEAGLLHKTDEDTLDDFRGVFRFDDAFPAVRRDPASAC